MNIQKSVLASVVSVALSGAAISHSVNAQEIFPDFAKQTLASSSIDLDSKTGKKGKSGTGIYIVQLKGPSAVAKALETNAIPTANSDAAKINNTYNSNSPAVAAYVASLQSKQNAVANEFGSFEVLYNYTHTFNGFSAKMSETDADALKNHPDVVGIWEDEVQQVTTANTPQFVGLRDINGNHISSFKGEDIIVGVVDSGIWPENPSFLDDGSFGDPADILNSDGTPKWSGACDMGSEADAGTFQCNDKLIGARYYSAGFSAVYDIQFALGETLSPRDADGHGSHTASTAAGNENVEAFLQGVSVGKISGIAPRARVAAYKVCWNADYVSPEGVDERGCFGSDSMMAIDQAVADGVDVINYSISGSRTSLTPPQTSAMLRAADAGVFVSVSAGNSGADPSTVGTPAPWVTSVAASTYDGTSAVIGQTLKIDQGSLAGVDYLSIAAGFGPSIPSEGFSDDLALAEPLDGCDLLTNPTSIDGKIALITRGGCNFTLKVQNAQLAGATGVVVFNNQSTAPFVMGISTNPDKPEVTIPSVMISNNDGVELLNSFEESSVAVTMSEEGKAGESIEVGNIMADFSSRGPNLNTGDVIKPDITAPGVRILAATSGRQVNGTVGETNTYLQGTSMSSPHIAGMAALLSEANPLWSPAQMKSALMTTARQNVTYNDAPATPFNFGSGHAVPIASMDPGLTYNTGYFDYMAFLCGNGEETFVASESGFPCSAYEGAGFSFDASQLNYPSIAVDGLIDEETVVRVVTDVSGIDSTYTATIEAPSGINATFVSINEEGELVEDAPLFVPANGTVAYGVRFERTASAQSDTWVFGAITLTDSAGHVVRSPIAISAINPPSIIVPPSVSLELERGRASFPVQMKYRGTTSLDYAGLVAPFGFDDVASDDPERTYEFGGPGVSIFGFLVNDDTKVLRFSLANSLVGVAGSDLDLYVYRCIDRSCSLVGQSLNAASNENVILVDPEPANDGAAGDFYRIEVHGYSVPGGTTDTLGTTDFTMLGWFVDSTDRSTRVRSSRRAAVDRFNDVTISTSGLNDNSLYMGGITFYDGDGNAAGTTAVEVRP